MRIGHSLVVELFPPYKTPKFHSSAYYVCIDILTLDAGLLARSQYPEGPATGHLDTGFSLFPCVYK